MPSNSKSYFEDLFEHTTDLIHFLNIDGTIKFVNPAWLTTLGYEAQDMTGRSIYDFIHPDYIAGYKTNRSAVIASQTISNIEIIFVTNYGKLVTGEGEIGCSYKNGVPVYTRCIFKNITSRKEMELRARESENRLKAFFNSAPDAVIVINERQQIVEWNPKAEIIFGFTAREVTGKTLTETIIPQQYREGHISGMHHFLQTGSGPVLNKTIEITALHKSGKEFYISLSVSNVRFNDQWLFIGFLSDISERKATEEALIRKEAELIQNKLLDEEKDQFISIAGHEFKTPVTTIKAYTQMALSVFMQRPEETKRYLQKIDQSTDKLTFLLNELLDFSRIGLKKLQLVKIKTNISAYLKDVLESLQYTTRTHKILLVNNEEATISIDPLRIEQVLTNIISNAVKYSPGQNEIIVSSVVDKQNLKISVTDFGIGIKQENVDKIFTRFYRVEEDAAKFSGFGIGLYISSEIIKSHAGSIWAESEPGKGSVFYVSLPLSHQRNQDLNLS